jgi:2-amino-4-hydroxy-6-hydroxymethyldihydropteridine diphosphokinase
VVECETSLSTEALLDAIHQIEAEGGRVRDERWGPRMIDIDILCYDDVAIANERLVIPHPGIAERAFVARPLVDIAANYRLSNGSLLRDRLSEEPLSTQTIVQLSGTHSL